MIPFNFHHLYYFYTIAELGAVSRAAEKLHISQPALSAQVKQFESYLKVKLFERKGKRLTLTTEGQSAFEYARVIFDTGKEFIDNLQDRSQRGRIRLQIGVSNSIPKILAGTLIKFILKVSPEAHIILHEDTPARMVDELRNHALDIVLSDTAVQVSDEEKITNNLIARIPIVFCAHPRLARKYKHLPRQLNGAPMILLTSHSQTYHAVQEYFAINNVRPRIVAEIQDAELVHRMVLDGIGIAPLNRFAVLHGSSRNKLVLLGPQAKHGIHDTIYLITKQRQNPHPLTEMIVERFKF